MSINTVRIHSRAAEAIRDADTRSNKAIWLHLPSGHYAVGDHDDLPPQHLVFDGEWHELSRAELEKRAREMAFHGLTGA